ncbi:MAG: hypothetical protein Q4C88_01105 [Akkermansia sp.]|nr:hypothetical protein [Akkermansia sp.]
MQPDFKEIATTVANDPASYKLCAVCGAVVDRDAATCPDCTAYRFDTDPEHVLNRALDLGSKPRSSVTHLDTVE